MNIVAHYNQQLVASGWTQLKSHSEYELYCAAHRDPCHYVIRVLPESGEYAVTVTSRRDRSWLTIAMSKDVVQTGVWIKQGNDNEVNHHLPEERMVDCDTWFAIWELLKEIGDSANVEMEEPEVLDDNTATATVTQVSDTEPPVPWYNQHYPDHPTLAYWQKIARDAAERVAA